MDTQLITAAKFASISATTSLAIASWLAVRSWLDIVTKLTEEVGRLDRDSYKAAQLRPSIAG